VTVAGLTIANGSATSATDPSQQGGGGFGGGAFVGATEGGVTPSLAVIASNIAANSADGGAGGSTGPGVGGGVYNLGDFSAFDAVIAGNHASTSDDDLFT
jgi:hypothetical protein